MDSQDTQEWFAIKIMSKAKLLRKRQGINMLFNEVSSFSPPARSLVVAWKVPPGPISMTRRVALQLQVLSQLPRSNFWITLHWAFQDKRFCYLAFDLLIGGDLRYHISNIGRTFTEKETCFYVSSVILCLDHVSGKVSLLNSGTAI